MTAQLRILLSLTLMAASAALVWLVFFQGKGQPAGPTNTQLTPGEPYQKRDFSRGQHSNLNISVFTYHDRDLSGSYNLGDLPMAGVYVELNDPEGSRQRVGSNTNGYVNYKMAKGDSTWMINTPGAGYTFTALAPPGWRITSPTAQQNIEFIELQGSVAGLVAKPAPDAVGLAPNLTISGRVVPSDTLPEDLQLSTLGPGGDRASVEFGEDGRYAVDAKPGSWQLEFRSESSSWQVQREVQVKHAPVELASISVGKQIAAPQAHEVKEDFDWLSRARIDKIPNGHLGLDWFYLLATHNQLYGGPGYVNALVSGQAVGYNSSGHPVTISAPEGQRFDFVGAYFAVAWPTAEGEILDLRAERDGELVGSHSLTLSHLGAIWLDAEFRNIDPLTLSTRHYWQFVVDDMLFRVAEAP